MGLLVPSRMPVSAISVAVKEVTLGSKSYMDSRLFGTEAKPGTYLDVYPVAHLWAAQLGVIEPR